MSLLVGYSTLIYPKMLSIVTIISLCDVLVLPIVSFTSPTPSTSMYLGEVILTLIVEAFSNTNRSFCDGKPSREVSSILVSIDKETGFAGKFEESTNNSASKTLIGLDLDNLTPI